MMNAVRESTLFKGNIGICHGSYASTLIGYEALTTRRRCFHGGNAHPQTHPFSPRRRRDESRRRDRARDGPGAPPGCDRNARVARVRADGTGRRRDSTGDAVRRPQHPPDRIRECGRPPLLAERVRAVRRDLLRTGKRHQPLGPHGALRHPRGDDARLRLPHAACGSLRHARDRCGRLRGRERDGGRAVPAHDARSGPGQPHGQIQTVGEREGRNLGIVEPLRREVGEEQGSRVRGSRVEGVDRPFSGNDREYGNGARRDRFRVPGGRADEAVPYRPGPGKDFKSLVADEDAHYDDTVDIDLGTLEPLIACPSSPDNVKPVSEVAGTEVAQVAVGSSVNSSFRDLGVVAHALDGKHVAPAIAMAVSPGSRQTLLLMLTSGLMTKLIKAGVRELEVACGPCIGMGFGQPTEGASVRTFNRNFEGRVGTADEPVYLCSAATAAATAVRGVITDPRGLGKYPTLKEPTNYPVDTSGFEWPPKDRSAVQIVRGPNIAPLPVAAPPKDSIEGEVLIRLGDNISTDHIMPAGAKILPFRSNIPAIAEHVFEYVDPTFPERAKKSGGRFIVAGEN